MYQIQLREARRVLVRRFPYAIYFVYEEKCIEIFAILHQMQDTKIWQSRVR